ncbi:MAG: flagellar hook-associated protein FlgK, partial [Bauldia sp.]|nr:flagellar hook-associated protein FlgK [Bauldia sp.]
LIEAFAETDQSGGGGPALAGLFAWSGGPGIPAGGMAVPGLAAAIRVNSLVDPAKGGSLDRLRDGGVNGADYAYNVTGAASFAARLDALVVELGAARAFDPAAGLASGIGLVDFGTASVSWLEGLRRETSDTADYQSTLLARASEALSNAVGVNMDDEYALQLQLEQSYAASSKLIGVIKQLFDTLLETVG